MAKKDKKAEAPAAAPAGGGDNGGGNGNGGPRVKPRLQTWYEDTVRGKLQEQFGFVTPMQVPRMEKITINVGLGEASKNPKLLEAVLNEIGTITGQKPVVTKAKKAISNFSLREGVPVGVTVTLRRERMWEFLDRLINVSMPRIRDFRGVPGKSFDGRGNYSLGMREQLAFPEIDYDKIDRLRGLEVSIVTTAKTDEESKRLLQLLGMPFAN